MVQSETDVLADRLGRFPADRYPVQHATTQFHLGSVLLQAGETTRAVAALRTAREIFSLAGMSLEQAKATMMEGIGLRGMGRLDEAAEAFTAAGRALGSLGQPAEQGAAVYNLGLVRQDCQDTDGAQRAWSQAHDLFIAAGHPAQASAAARDHGGSLLATGQPRQAEHVLARALELAEQARDEAGAGAAANALGLAHLAAEAPGPAITALRRALAAFPRSVRPADYAMVKANLALAHEQAGDPARARLAARQALAVPAAATAVRDLAGQVLSRLPGQPADDLLVVLDSEEPEHWSGVLREELLRATDISAEQRRALIRGLLDGILARPATSYDLTERLIQVLLELPPRAYDRFVDAIVEACAGRPDEQSDRIRAVISSAMARFALPQWQRLAASFNTAAAAAGLPTGWA